MNKKTTIILLVCLTFGYSVPALYSQTLTINEVMPSNSAIIADEDGDYPDWLELFNNSAEPIDLTGYGLSDNTNNPFKWVFPSIAIQPQGQLLIYASGKDRRTQVAHWETIIDRGDVWSYRAGDAAIPANWNTLEYNSSGWQTGASGFGFGDGDDATTFATGTISVYVRKVITLSNSANITKAVLHVDYDDAFVAYLNGVEIARANIGVPGTPPPFNEPASSQHEAVMYAGGFPEKYEIDSIQDLLREGDNVLAIQVHNINNSSTDLSLIPFFTLGLAEPPDNPSGAPEILQMQKSALHTNFKISASGETLVLSASAGAVEDTVTIENIPTDVSRGRQPDGSANWFLFANPTPGASNNTPGHLATAVAPQFSLAGGFYNNGVEVVLSKSSLKSTILYTLDGSEPTESSLVYAGPIAMASTTVVRARVFGPDLLPSAIVTQTYFINAETSLPVFSISTTPDNLFDIDTGIYTLGRNYQTSNPYNGANFWQDWEVPVHVEFYEGDGTPGFSIDAGAKIVGGWSRANPQKALAIFARSKYGYEAIKYPLFPDRPFAEFQAFILRNCGNDWGRTFFSDGLMHELVESIDLDNMAFRPCAVYINGEYWGILNLREKQNEHYIAMHHDVDADSIDLLEFNQSVIHGDAEHYKMLMNFISNNDLSRSENYDYVKSLMYVDNFIDYTVAQIYFDNRDWPGNNIKYWRPKTETGKWRWLLYDTDWGFGINAYGRGGNQFPYDYNTLVYATSPTQTPNHHANPPWSTLLLRRLLLNEEFRNNFINRFADYFNTVFRPDVVVEKIYEIQEILEPEMPQHVQKWSQYYPEWSLHNLGWNDMDTWYAYIQVMIDFANNRIPIMRDHIINKFNLAGNATISLNISPLTGGLIKINTVVPDKFPWQGDYFRNVPLTVTAIPHSDYKFSHWSGLNTSNADSITIRLTGNGSLTAVFEPKTGNRESVVFNEINYNSNSGFNSGDWIELYNNSDASVSLAGWYFKDADDNNVFYFPSNAQLAAQEYLVLCSDTAAFKTHFPGVENFTGNLNFGLSRTGESIRLFDYTNVIVDSVIYGNRYPWPIMPDGGGATLELKNPDMNNALAMNWHASKAFGTPGAKNDSYITLAVDSPAQRPEQFRLNPNYPNPFNAATTLSFQLTEPAFVRLAIYNIAGQLVEVLLNETIYPGSHAINWQAEHLSSGIYFYKISAGKFTAAGKCLLLK